MHIGGPVVPEAPLRAPRLPCARGLRALLLALLGPRVVPPATREACREVIGAPSHPSLFWLGDSVPPKRTTEKSG